MDRGARHDRVRFEHVAPGLASFYRCFSDLVVGRPATKSDHLRVAAAVGAARGVVIDAIGRYPRATRPKVAYASALAALCAQP